MSIFDDTDQIVIEQKKITSYLLNPEHPDGYGKARLFLSCGFKINNWLEFAEAVRIHAKRATTKTRETEFGMKIIAEGNLETPLGKSLLVRSIWIVVAKTPILVTLYPLKK
jgi:filamentous hemagglutinin